MGRRYANLFLLLREVWGLIPQGTLRQRMAPGWAGKGVAGVLDPHQLLGPRGGVGGDQAAQSSLEVLVGSLQLAIGLGVEPRGQAGRRPTEGAERLPEPGRELRRPVGNHVHGQSMDPEDVLPHELGRLLGRGY